ncbi:isoprenylcysteine carboxylmethyltransferase family protein [soil metagenome]
MSTTSLTTTSPTTAALIIYVAWLAIALVSRGVLQYVRTGDHGFRLHGDRPFTGAWFARIGFVVALVIGGLSPVLVLTHTLAPIGAIDTATLRLVGFVLAVAGVAATFIAQLAMGASWRVGVDSHERTELIVRWPFTLVRNPIFSAMGATVVGLALMVPTWLALAGVVLLGWSLEYQVRRVEEPYLRSVHAEHYEQYVAQVGRFIPGVGRSALQPDRAAR